MSSNTIFLKYIFQNSDRFLIENTQRCSFNIRNESSTKIIRFVGRQHSQLTGVMEQMNVCFTLQVTHSEMFDDSWFTFLSIFSMIIQMIVNAAYTFLFSILTLYTLYLYFIQRSDELEAIFFMHLTWYIFFSSSTLTVIYTANQVNSEVNVSTNE